MGFGSPIHWLIVLAIVVLIFGTGKLKNLGKDLGASIKALRKRCRTVKKRSPQKMLRKKTYPTIKVIRPLKAAARNV